MVSRSRAEQVIDLIHEGIASVESQCERMCMLIQEAKQNEYWKVRYKSEAEWIVVTFGSKAAFRHLYYLSEAHKNQPGLITEVGRKAAEMLIPVARAEGRVSEEWIAHAKRLKYSHLDRKIRDHYPSRQGRSERSIILKRIEYLESRIHFYQTQIPICRESLSIARMKLDRIDRKSA